MYDVKITITGKELKYFVYWLIDNTDNDWNIAIWPRHIYRKPGRVAPYRISSINWERDVYKISGLSRNDMYDIDIMLESDLDTMAVKLSW